MGNFLAMMFSSSDSARYAIEENEKKRQLRFQEMKDKCADLDEATRNEILELSFFQLKGKLND
jgi:hypothetical protein